LTRFESSLPVIQVLFLLNRFSDTDKKNNNIQEQGLVGLILPVVSDVQVASRRLPTAAARVRSQVRSRGISGG
jgi:hypothetical protein